MFDLDFDAEQWRDIPGYEGLYQASTCGRIKSLNWEGCTGKEKLLSLYQIKGGYLIVRLNKNSIRKKYLVHRLIGWTYPEICGEYFEKATINHLDENPQNNTPQNLRWCTQLENNLYGNHLKNISISKRKRN